MSYYIGQFYVGKRDIFLLMGAILLVIALYLHYPIPYFDTQNLLILFILAFFTKGLLLPTHDSAVFLTFLLAVFLTLFIPLLEVLFFLVLSFLFLRLTKVI